MSHREAFLRECLINLAYGGVPHTGPDTFGWSGPRLAQTLTGGGINQAVENGREACQSDDDQANLKPF